MFHGETWVEIEVRGDFILDCNGQPVDANAVGRAAAPTGNGTPGGTLPLDISASGSASRTASRSPATPKIRQRSLVMSGTNSTVPSSRGTSTLVRPRFGPGMLLQHEDLDQLGATPAS